MPSASRSASPDQAARRRRRHLLILVAAVIVASVVVASGALPPGPGGDPALLRAASGGDGTVQSASRDAFGSSARNLTNEERRTFEVGDSFFTQNWVTAPASTDARDGLGPLFNAMACASCHVRDGRARPPADSPNDSPGLLLRISVPGDDPYGTPTPHHAYGDQIQDRAILGVDPEATVVTEYEEIAGTYPDGTSYSLRTPTYTFEDLAYGPLPDDLMVSPRIAPPVFGGGLLEAIPEEAILERADPDDTDGDGVSGRPNYVFDHQAGEIALGRFGWKANAVDVTEQSAAAFIGDLGITSSLFPNENCTAVQTDCAAAPNGGTPEITDDRLDKVSFYVQTLAVPARRNLDDSDVIAGAGLFDKLGCETCHRAWFTTGDHEIEALSGQDVHPFSDLLLHDMGDDLADGRPDFLADGNEWRTPPLWGIGLTEAVNGHTTFLHDGRARSLEEAILWHGGEAAGAQQSFTALSADDRSRVIAFLESL